ncbi:MAG: glycosyltransferase [Pseudomonadota bacterium]
MVALWVATAYAVLMVIRLGLAWRRADILHDRSETDLAITIYQPILSGDPMLETCLAANLRAAPAAHFVWLIDDDDPDAQAIAARLADPRVTVLLGRGPRDGENPKLLKLDRPAIPDGIVLVLDDDTVLRPGGAAALAAAAEQHEGLACALPVWSARPRTLAEACLASFINGQGASLYLSMAALGRTRTINGMAYAVRGADLRRLGGFAAAGHALTDDWAVAQLWRRAGLPCVQTTIPAEVATSLSGFSSALSILRRWMQFAWMCLRGEADLVIASLIALPPLLALVGVTLAVSQGPVFVGAWVVLLVARAYGEALLRRKTSNLPVTPGGLALAAVIEPVLPLLSAAAFVRPSQVRWRSRKMEIVEGEIHYR